MVNRFTKDIKMQLGLEKCRINAMENGKWTEQAPFPTEEGEIEGMEEDEIYKYLGLDQKCTLDKVMKDKVRDKLRERITDILKSSLSGINKAKAVNTYALPVATYTFGIIRWTQTELASLDTLTRTLFTKFKAHHPKSSVERFHLPRSRGGRGIIHLSMQHANQTHNLHTYFTRKAQTSPLHAAIVNIDKNLSPLNLHSPTCGCPTLAPTSYTRRHDNVAKIIHQALLMQIEPNHTRVPYYQYTSASVTLTETAKLYWNRTVITDKHIPNNRPNIILTSGSHTYLIDITVPLPENMKKKEREKITKYLPLAEEIRQMWQQEKVTIIPIVVGATGEVPFSLKPALKTLNIKENTYLQMQKLVIIDTCNIVRTFLHQQSR
ncbi:hypothetical protein NQ314_014599 [Rhamnusium bicolor]|uniref:Uncharacterized protein n=1 Tax=Rhamnusium bicolor TaxID=1586634 RepID=A0AAV8X1K1_9CUCU|nr:hypothetical protein NQ314_014599 [Rhamnusium bicolor]